MSPPRKFIWARHDFSFSGAASAVSRADLLGAFNTRYGADLVGATVIRIRGIIMTSSTQFNQGSVVGVRTQSETSAAVTVAEGPVAQPFADWMLYEPFVTNEAGVSTSDVSGRLIDVKSARKLEELGDMAAIYVQMGAGNTADVTVSGHLSVGLKLP